MALFIQDTNTKMNVLNSANNLPTATGKSPDLLIINMFYPLIMCLNCS